MLNCSVSPSWEAASRLVGHDTSRVLNIHEKFAVLTMITKARHWNLSWASWAQFTRSHPIFEDPLTSVKSFTFFLPYPRGKSRRYTLDKRLDIESIVQEPTKRI
jgi:hypothetical protein